jgi:hypothetical protein
MHICHHLQQIKVAVTIQCNGICSIPSRRCCDGHHHPISIEVVFTMAWIVFTNTIDGCVLGMWDASACCVFVAAGEWNWEQNRAEGMMAPIGLAGWLDQGSLAKYV